MNAILWGYNMVRSAHWRVHYPFYFYAGDLRFKRPQTEREVRAYLREYHSMDRLTKGTEVYPVIHG